MVDSHISLAMRALISPHSEDGKSHNKSFFYFNLSLDRKNPEDRKKTFLFQSSEFFIMIYFVNYSLTSTVQFLVSSFFPN